MGSSATRTNDASICDTARPLQIRTWIGFLGTCNRVFDRTNVEVVIEIRYDPVQIAFWGIDATTPSTLTPSYQIDNHYMTVFNFNFDDD